MLTFSFSSAAPSSLIFFSGVTSGELFSSVGNANGSDLPGDDNVDKKDDDDEEEEEKGRRMVIRRRRRRMIVLMMTKRGMKLMRKITRRLVFTTSQWWSHL